MIILFLGEGRLGNQIFQFTAIRKNFGLAKIYSPSLRTLGHVFSIADELQLKFSSRTAEKVIRRILAPVLLRPLFKWLRLGTYATELAEKMDNGSIGSGGNVTVQKGLLNLALLEGGYYQNLTSLLSPSDFRCLKIRDDVLAAAQSVVAQVTNGRPSPRAVMHVRRGDYLGFKTYGLDDVVLPVSYYQRAAALARSELGVDAEILVVTDDAKWCESELEGLKPFVIVSGSEAVDFALLSMFSVAILSNSTFSLAAACVGPDVEKVIGPEFWFGHTVQRWYPPQIKSSDERFVYV